MLGIFATVATAGEEEPAAPVRGLEPVKVSDTEFRFGRLSFNPKTREIWFPCRVNQNEGVLEFAICEEERGKLHESLLSTKVTPMEIQIAMKLLRWQASGRDFYHKYNSKGEPIGPMKDDGKGRMEILVRYRSGGEEVTVPIGEWMRNEMTGIGAGAWIYTGSKVIGGTFLATEDGAIAANYRFEGALCNAFNPGSDDDELWFPVADKMPPLDTEVTAILRPLADVTVPADRRLAPGTSKKSPKLETAPTPEKL